MNKQYWPIIIIVPGTILAAVTFAIIDMLPNTKQPETSLFAEDPPNTDELSLPNPPKTKNNILESKEYAPRVAAIKNMEINEAQRKDLLDELKIEFQSKKVYFTGTIKKISTYGRSYEVDLENEDGYEAQCHFDKDERGAVYSLRVGQIKTVAGEIRFFMYDGKMVFMNNCEVDKRK